MQNEPWGHEPQLYGTLTAREFYEWFVIPACARKEKIDKILGKDKATGDSYGMQAGDTVVEPPMTEEGTLFFLRSLGVQGVPDSRVNGDAGTSGSGGGV